MGIPVITIDGKVVVALIKHYLTDCTSRNNRDVEHQPVSALGGRQVLIDNRMKLEIYHLGREESYIKNI